MSRTRKGGKYKGSNFASQFKQGLSMQSPMFAVAVNDGSTTEEEAPVDKIDGKPPQLSELEDIVDEKVGSSARRIERQNWKVRAEQEAERQKAEEEKKALEEQRAQEAIQAEEDREARSQGQEILDETTKRGIKDAKKEAKQTARDEKRAKKEEAKKLKGKAKRQAKRKARKEFRGDKKKIRQNKRTAKRNRKGK
jgi:hypothetical protein